MEQLAKYFFEHLTLDFEGEFNLKIISEMVANDPQGLALLSKLKSESDVDDFILDLLESLKDFIESGISHETILNEFKEYSES